MMQMSKPTTTAAAGGGEAAESSSSSSTSAANHNISRNKPSPDAVADLERRLAQLDSLTPSSSSVAVAVAAAPVPSSSSSSSATAAAAAATATKPKPPGGAAAAKGGKNALLVSFARESFQRALTTCLAVYLLVGIVGTNDCRFFDIYIYCPVLFVAVFLRTTVPVVVVTTKRAPSPTHSRLSLSCIRSRIYFFFFFFFRQARIMAAQEKAKQAHGAPATATAAPAGATAASDAPPPSYEDKNNSDDLLMMEFNDPPAFDASLLPPPPAAAAEQPPPPAFDDALLPPPPPPPPASAGQQQQQQQSLMTQWDPHAPTPPPPSAPRIRAPPVPSAPALEDLLSDANNGYGGMPPPMQVPPPSAAPAGGMDDAAVEAILGIPGLSDEEKRQLIEEQAKILASIEKSKNAGASARADAFEQRATANAVQAVSSSSSGQRRHHAGDANTVAAVQLGDERMELQGQEQTRAAIATGTAVVAQCLACENYMQVTPEATLMLCPVCETVSPVVLAEGGGGSAVVTAGSEEAQQLQADMKLAEQLQKEEYKAAERAERRQASSESRRKQQAAAAAESGQSWMEWLGLSAAASTASGAPERPSSFAQGPVERGNMGVSRPPGSASGSPTRLTAAQTETVTFSSSRDEEDALMARGSRMSPARIAEQKPLFNCVADSISTAATGFATALHTTTLSEDGEGNVHGVDASGLLAVPNIRRDSSGYDKMDDGRS